MPVIGEFWNKQVPNSPYKDRKFYRVSVARNESIRPRILEAIPDSRRQDLTADVRNSPGSFSQSVSVFGLRDPGLNMGAQLD